MDPELDDEGIPAAVAETRRALIDAAVACDYAALEELFGERGPFLVDSVTSAPSAPSAVIDRWIHREEQHEPVLAGLVTALSSGWLCGPEVANVVEGREGEACAFLSGGAGKAPDRALVALVGIKGRFLGFGSHGGVQDAVLEMWADTVTGVRNEDHYTQRTAGLGRLPRGWPVGVPPAVLLAED
jgi:hypothetical protein